jgi:hypothetical protein
LLSPPTFTVLASKARPGCIPVVTKPDSAAQLPPKRAERLPAKPESRRLSVERCINTVAGMVLIGGAFALNGVTGSPSALAPIQATLVGIGCVLAAFGMASRHRGFNAALARASLVLLSSFLALALLEASFRALAIDFTRLNEPGDDVPIYYRKPTLHAGDGVFRRAGPAVWRGKVLSAYMRLHGADETVYANERPVAAHYDALGFRNPPGQKDWEIVVAGDSFVEAGYLAYEELFATIAGKQLGARVRNLGVSGTGPISQTFYLRHYGRAPSARHAVLCFFEGNDFEDLSRELRNAESFRRTVEPWEHQRQTSFLRAIFERMAERRRGAVVLAPVTPNAVLVRAAQEQPVTVYTTPPAWASLGQRRRERLAQALSGWAGAAREHGMQPWVLYLPDSHRVFHGSIRYSEPSGPLARWRPEELGVPLGDLCTNVGIGFINAFPALRRDFQAGGTPYNLVGDTHLSAHGSRVVACVLAEALKADAESPPAP